jgi:selenocysteine-specific elongation factor
MPYVIGTAGHIDHGKTSLVKALTGIDTDRLKEEKERGISIDLGFAHLDLADGTRVGIVDVPGHERFIRNMLAGAHGIDLVLFTVAADDGVMPQTEEHFDIVHVLGIEHAIFVITKSDLVPEARLSEVAEEIAVLAAGTALERSPIVPFSFLSGEGLGQLRAEMMRTLNAIRTPAPPGYFRLPIDRVFTLQGHGLIVTGTALAGEVSIGDRLRAMPGEQTFRVRSVQVHNQPVEKASWGQRVALNLTAQEKPLLARGFVLCDERIAISSLRFDAWIEGRMSGGTPAAIKNHQRLRVYLGTAERPAKVVLLDGSEQIRSKETAFCQIVLADPLIALRGDRFVIRDETAMRTLGGGLVLHPSPRIHRRKEPALLERLTTLRDGDAGAAVELFIDDQTDFAATLDAISQFLNQTSQATLAIVRASSGLHPLTLEGGDQIYTTQRKWHGVKDTLIPALQAFHGNHPLAAGQEMDELRDRLPWPMTAKVFRSCVSAFEEEHLLVRDGGVLRLPTHIVALRHDEQVTAEHILSLLRASPLTPPDLKEIERRVPLANVKLGDVMRVLEYDGTIVRLSGDLYFLTDTLGELRRALQRELSSDELLTPAMFRDRFGTSRKYTIPLLEYLDREGVTQRVGDARRLKTPAPASRR